MKKGNSFSTEKISKPVTDNNSTDIREDGNNHDKSSNGLPFSFWNNEKSIKESNEPSFSFTVIVSKSDTIVHAGNADLILELLKIYNSTVYMFVLRPESDNGRIQLEMSSDDIWAKGISNGEKMLFEFFGPVPSKELLRELSIRVNKYTQMDKIIP